MTSKIKYKGNLRTEAFHTDSGNSIITDAPKDNMGLGNAYSPTDLVATGLGSCMLTVMGIVAQRNNIDMDGTIAEIEKIMYKDPRRIGEIKIKITFNKTLAESDRKKLIKASNNCPVRNSLSTDLKELVEYV